MIDFISGIFILLGAAFALIAGIGLFRLPDVYLRMHAATKAGTLGAGLVLLALALDAQQRPAFFAALNGLGQSPVVPAPGGVLIRNQQGVVLGAIGISGDTSDIDEQCAISAIEEAGLTADAGVAA